jgi:hypothetical protein
MSDFGWNQAAPTPIEDLAEPLVGWRGWSIYGTGGNRGELTGRLYSISGISRHPPWPTGEEGGMRAECYCACRCALAPGNPRTYTSYGGGYGCGIYAMRSYRDLVETPWGSGRYTVIGQVKLGGRVWAHRSGWRAQFASVSALAPVDAAELQRRVCSCEICEQYFTVRVEPELIDRIAARYGVPVLDAAEVG